MSEKQFIAEKVSLAKYATFKIGGPADYLCEVRAREQWLDAVMWAAEKSLPVTVLGRGSNVLISDEGVSGLVIINRYEGIETLEDALVVNSGHSLEDVVKRAVTLGWSGMQCLAGIPGTIGGAVCGNAGAYGCLIEEFLISATVIDQYGEIKVVDREFFQFKYRHSRLKVEPYWLLDVKLGGFGEEAPDILLARRDEIQRERWGKLPGPEDLCAGSFFKNLEPLAPGAKRQSIGRLLDIAGARELRVGGAAVYHCHANVIINCGSAKAGDICELARRMASLLYHEFAIEAVPEVRFIGRNLRWEGIDKGDLC